MIDVQVIDKTKDVLKAVDKATFRNMGHAAASIRKTAAASIIKANGPSAPGRPPHTHRRVFLRRSLRFFVDRKKNEAVIGPRASIVGDVGEVLEKGGRRGNTIIAARPFMAPALAENVPRFAKGWAGSIGD